MCLILVAVGKTDVKTGVNLAECQKVENCIDRLLLAFPRRRPLSGQRTTRLTKCDTSAYATNRRWHPSLVTYVLMNVVAVRSSGLRQARVLPVASLVDDVDEHLVARTTAKS